jgi:hypothetical protein
VCGEAEKACAGRCVAIDDPTYGCSDTSCAACALPDATAGCTAGECVIAACATGYADCDRSPADGCEASLSSAAHCGSCDNACPYPDGCHALGACDPTSGTCPVLTVADGSPCVLGNSCTSGDVCTAGVCGGTAPCPTGNCGASLSAFTGANTPGWTFNGVATYDASTNTVVLVDAGQRLTAGTVIYGDPIATDALTVTFDLRMTTSGGDNGRADGIAFMLETTGATALGNTGGGLGIAGLSGFGVELDIYNNFDCGDADDDHAGVDALTACGAGEPLALATSPYLSDSTPSHGVGDLGDGQWRTAIVTLAHAQLSVAITPGGSGAALPVTNLQGVALPGFVQGGEYYLGFAAGGGNLAGRQEIRNVAVTFPSTRCL